MSENTRAKILVEEIEDNQYMMQMEGQTNELLDMLGDLVLSISAQADMDPIFTLAYIWHSIDEISDDETDDDITSNMG